MQTAYNILSLKWKHLLPEEGNFESEIDRWKFIVMVILKKKLLHNYFIKMLIRTGASMHLGGTSNWQCRSWRMIFLRQIHLWLRSTMTNERLGI